MPRLALLLTLACAAPAAAQAPSPADLDAFVLAYTPAHRPGVPDADFRKGRMILQKTAEAVEARGGQFNLTDYFNAFVAFTLLHEDEPTTRRAYAAFHARPGSCEYLTDVLAGHMAAPRYDAMRPDIERDIAACRSGNAPAADAPSLDVGSDPALFALMARISADDRRHRTAPLAPGWAERQRPLDEENLRLIDSLYAAHGTYVGRSLVGDQATTMWAVIQHSNLDAMRRYAPVLRQAVRDGELPPGPYRMLVDRIYALAEGYQLYGSQGDVPLGTEAQREAAQAAYDLD